MNIESKNFELKSKIKPITIDVISSSTTHGLPNIIRSSIFSIKLMWTFFTIISTGLCAYLIVKSIITYFNYEVTTSIRIKNEFRSIFPTITVCNTNYFTTNYSMFILKSMLNDSMLINPLDNKNELIAKTITDRNINLNKNQFGDSLNKLIIACQYSMCMCNLSQVNPYFHPNYGNCYSINSGYDNYGNEVQLMSTIAPSRTFSIRLVLNTSVLKELRYLNPISGAIILVHNQSSYPMFADEVTIMPKTETNIALFRTYYNSLPKPYSECEVSREKNDSYDSMLYRLIYQNTKSYSQILCVTMCFQRLVIKECNCYISNFPSFFEKKDPCIQHNNLCLINQFNKFSETNYVSEVCFRECPLECNRMSFQKTVSMTKFLNDEWINFLKIYNQSDALYFNKTIQSDEISAVSVYYETLSYVQIEELASMDIVDLLSNIGGIAGLFLGVSVLSFVEIIEIIMQIFITIRSRHN